MCHRKYRGHTTRSELYGYRNGNKIEALELCMVPAGEEHTIGPRQVKLSQLATARWHVHILILKRKSPLKHSIKTSTLFRRKLLGNIEDPDHGSDHEFADEDKQFKHMKTISSEVDNLKSPED